MRDVIEVDGYSLAGHSATMDMVIAAMRAFERIGGRDLGHEIVALERLRHPESGPSGFLAEEKVGEVVKFYEEGIRGEREGESSD